MCLNQAQHDKATSDKSYLLHCVNHLWCAGSPAPTESLLDQKLTPQILNIKHRLRECDIFTGSVDIKIVWSLESCRIAPG